MKKSPRIQLRRETLRVLAILDLGQVAGGQSGDKCTAEVILASQDARSGACDGHTG